MKKLMALLLVLVLACGCLTGCGGGSGSSADSDANADGVTELVLWCSYTEASTTVLKQLIDKFNKEYPQYHMTVENPGTVAQFRTKLATLNAEDYPSVFFGTTSAIGEYATAAYVSPIQKYIDADEENWTEDMYKNVKKAYSDLDGNMIGSPLGLSAKGYMVNTTALEAAGYTLEDITSFEKLAEASKAAVDKGVVKYGYAIGDGSDIIDILLYQGVGIVDADNGYNGEITKTLYGEGDTHTALKKLLALQADLYEADAAYKNTAGTQGGLSLFLNNDLMFWTCTNSFVYEIEDMELKFDWSFLPHVGVDENAAYKDYALVEGTGMFIANTGNEAEMQGAYEFIKFMEKVENQVFWATYRGYVPFTEEAAAHEDWITYQNEVFPGAAGLIDRFKNTPEDFKYPYSKLTSQFTSSNLDLNSYIMTDPNGDLEEYINEAVNSLNESIEILKLRGQ